MVSHTQNKNLFLNKKL